MKNIISKGLVSILLLSGICALQNQNKLIEGAYDSFNETIKLPIRNLQIGSHPEVKLSKTYAQVGEKNQVYYLRFATAISGKINSAKYSRNAEGMEEKVVNISSAYQGVEADNRIIYYNENGTTDEEKLSSDEVYKGDYYWVCYTIAFETDNYKDTQFTLKLDVEDEEGKTYTSSRTTSLNDLISTTPVEKTAEVKDIYLEEENNKFYYVMAGNYTGEIDIDFIYFDLNSQKGSLNFGGKENMELITNQDNTFKLRADITYMPVTGTNYLPTLFINGNSNELVDEAHPFHNRVIKNGDNDLKILQTDNTGHRPIVGRWVVSGVTVPSDATYEVTKVDIVQENDKVLFHLSGTFNGYTFATLTKNFGFRILKNPSASATTINYGYTSIYDAYIKTEENTFLFVADITNLDLGGDSNPFYTKFRSPQETTYPNFTPDPAVVNIGKTITFNGRQFEIMYDKDGANLPGNAYKTVGIKITNI